MEPKANDLIVTYMLLLTGLGYEARAQTRFALGEVKLLPDIVFVIRQRRELLVCFLSYFLAFSGAPSFLDL